MVSETVQKFTSSRGTSLYKVDKESLVRLVGKKVVHQVSHNYLLRT